MRVTDYELSNLILRIEQDKDYTLKDSVMTLGALRDLVDVKVMNLAWHKKADDFEKLNHELLAACKSALAVLGAHHVKLEAGGTFCYRCGLDEARFADIPVCDCILHREEVEQLQAAIAKAEPPATKL